MGCHPSSILASSVRQPGLDLHARREGAPGVVIIRSVLVRLCLRSRRRPRFSSLARSPRRSGRAPPVLPLRDAAPDGDGSGIDAPSATAHCPSDDPPLHTREVRDADFVFSSETGGRSTAVMSCGGVSIRRSRRQGSLISPGTDLRHIAASALIAQGVSVAYLSRVLGHASPAITLSIYAHEFARAEHAYRMRDLMKAAFGDAVK